MTLWPRFFSRALSALGLFGLVSYAVKQSTREIGIRMALGASRASVVGGFLRSGLRLAAIGAAAGLIIAAGSARFLSSLLYGAPSTPPPTRAPRRSCSG